MSNKRSQSKEILHQACHDQDMELVRELLQQIKPAALNRRLTDYSGPLHGTPLHIACRIGDQEIVRLLVEAGADLEIKDVGRETALSIAAGNNHTELVAYLLEAGADVHAKGPNGLQPIHFACERAGRDVLELLLSHGVDVNLKMMKNTSLLSFVTNLNGGNLEAAKVLVEYGIDTESYTQGFHEACWRNNPGIALYLLEKGADYRAVTTPKSELLFWICGLGHKEIVELLLERKVDFTQPVRFKGKMRSYDGSPLDRAVEVGNDEIVRMIRQANGA